MDVTALSYLLLALFGLLFGSFLNVAIYRIPANWERSRWTRWLVVSQPPRSFCPSCQAPIAAYDNIPVLSWLLLRGRCRRCHAAISWRYPVVEALSAVVLVTAAALFGWTLLAVKLGLLGLILVALFFTDLEHEMLPDEFTLGGLAAGLLLSWFVPMPPGLLGLFLPEVGPRLLSVIESAVGAGFFGLFFWLVSEFYYRVRKIDALGLGDVKLVATLGAFLGLGGGYAVIAIASISAVVIGTAIALIRRERILGFPLPFGCFLSVAGLIVIVLQRDGLRGALR